PLPMMKDSFNSINARWYTMPAGNSTSTRWLVSLNNHAPFLRLIMSLYPLLQRSNGIFMDSGAILSSCLENIPTEPGLPCLRTTGLNADRVVQRDLTNAREVILGA